MKPTQSVLVLKTFLVTFFVACTSFGQSANRIIDLSKVNLSNKTKSIQAETRQGPGSGGGGNTCALMLKQNAIELIERIQAYPPFQTNGVADLLIANIKAAQFLPGDNLQIAGKDVEALNYPTKKIIVIEQGFCDKVITFSTASLGITLHEYLGLAGFADEEYQISGPFVNSIYATERDKTFDRAGFLDERVNNLRAKFEKGTPVSDEGERVKTFNLSCTYFGETDGKSVTQLLLLQRSTDKEVLMQTPAKEAIRLLTQNTSSGLMATLPVKDLTSTSLLTLRQLGPEIFIAERSIVGNTLLDMVRLRKGPYPVPSTSVVGSQAMGYALCVPKEK